MKTTTRLLLVAAAPLLTAAPASAWCHRHMYSMAPMPVMPMLGFGATPMLGFGGLPTLPFAGLGTLPTTIAGGSGFSMQMSMSGDATMALLLPGLFRNLLGPLLGVAPAGGLTDAQMQALATRFAAVLRASGASPMTAEQATAILQELRNAIKAIQDAGKKARGEDTSSVASAELAKARAEVRRIVAEAAREKGQKMSPAQARAEVRRMVHEAARNNGQKTSPAKARAEVRRLVATGSATPKSNGRIPVTTTLAGPAR